jgi:hypothetical protein
MSGKVGRITAVRPGTTIVIVGLLLLILLAAFTQFVLHAGPFAPGG